MKILVVFLGIAMACAASAQAPVYKLNQGGGRAVYSDQQQPGAEARPDLGDTNVNVVAPVVTSKEAAAVNERLNERLAKREELWQVQLKALLALNAAKDAQKLGLEPLPGERLGIRSRASGGGRGSRLSDEYWARQAALQSEVDRLQFELDRAQDALRQFGN